MSELKFIAFAYRGRLTGLLLQILLNLLSVIITGLLLPLIMRHIIDSGIIHKSVKDLALYSGLGLCCIVAYALAQALVHRVKARIIDERIHEIGLDLFTKAILSSNPGVNYQPGYLSSRIFKDVKDFISKAVRYLTNLSTCVSGLIVAYGFMILSFGTTGIILCILLSIYPFLFQKMGRSLVQLTARFNESMASFNETVVDHLQSRSSTVTLGLFDFARKRYSRELSELLAANHHLREHSNRYAVATTLASQILQIAILLITGYASIRTGLSIGRIISGITVSTVLINYLSSLKQVLPQTATLNEHARRIMETGKMLEIRNNPEPHAEIKVDGARLAVGSKQLESAVSLRIGSGTSLHLKGPNGSGKSSLSMSLAGLQDHLTGSVKKPAQERIAYLASSPALLNVELHIIRDFLQEKAASFSALSDLWIDFGLVELEAQKAKRLSLGESQKLQFLLALAKDPDFYIFDESFSGLDTRALEKVRKVLAERMRGRGFMIIDHRASLTDICQQEYTLSGAVIS